MHSSHSPVIVASLAFRPEVVGQGYLKYAEAVGVLKDSTALDAIGILHTIHFIAQREVHPPFCCQVQTVSHLVFDSCT